MPGVSGRSPHRIANGTKQKTASSPLQRRVDDASTPLLKHDRKMQKLSDSTPVTYIPSQDDYTNGCQSACETPLRLLIRDVCTFIRMIPYLQYVLSPVRSKDMGAELYPGYRNARDYFLLGIVTSIQFVLLITGPVLLFVLPGGVSLIGGGLLAVFMWLILLPVQGPRIVHSTPKFVDEARVREFENERWLFINGVMTGNNGLQQDIDRVARTFQRPVIGIHNETNGFFGDVLECIVQRCFSYTTRDVRVAYDYIKGSVMNEEVGKVVIIAHSQGGIILSLVMDRLFGELSQETLSKVEVYTFGSAASHFSNPPVGPPEPFLHPRQRGTTASNASQPEPSSQSYVAPTPNGDATPYSSRATTIVPTSGGTATTSTTSNNSPVLTLKSPPSHYWTDRAPPPPAPASSSTATTATTATTTYTSHTRQPRTLAHVEHYANEYDMIPRWGVLYSIYSILSSRYSGRVFVRIRGTGHLFCQHYMDPMFPLDAQAAAGFLDCVMDVDEGIMAKREREAERSAEVLRRIGTGTLLDDDGVGSLGAGSHGGGGRYASAARGSATAASSTTIVPPPPSRHHQQHHHHDHHQTNGSADAAARDGGKEPEPRSRPRSRDRAAPFWPSRPPASTGPAGTAGGDDDDDDDEGGKADTKPGTVKFGNGRETPVPVRGRQAGNEVGFLDGRDDAGWAKGRTVRELSRLWRYVDGGRPRGG